MPPKRRHYIINEPLEDDILPPPPPPPRRQRQPLLDEIEPEELDETRFEDLAIQTRYFELNRTRAAVKERGIGADFLDDDRLEPLLEWLGWETFAKHPTDRGSLKLMLEFFATMPKRVSMIEREEHVTIRGTNVTVSAHEINEALGVPTTAESISFPVMTPDRIEQIGRALCVDEHYELNVRDSCEFRTKHLISPWKELAALWIGRIFPNSRGHFISFMRAEFIYHIARGVRPNIGELIFNNMRIIAATPHMALTYAHLITQLCRAQEVPISDDECDFPLESPITVAGYAQRKADIATGRVLPAIFFPPEGEVPTAEFILQQPPSPVAAEPEMPAPPPPRQRAQRDVLTRLDEIQHQLDDRWERYQHDREEMQRQSDERWSSLQQSMASLTSSMASILQRMGPDPSTPAPDPSAPSTSRSLARRGRRGD